MTTRTTAAMLAGAIALTGFSLSAAPVTSTQAHAATTYTKYTVKRGDTLSRIAKNHRTTVKAIAAASGIKNVNVLRVGQVLRIPVTSSTPAPKPAPKPAPRPTPTTAAAKNVITTTVIGKSVQGRNITAYLVGDPKATRTEMVLGNMHGDEPRTDDTAWAIIRGPKVKGVKIWVVPTINPDGLARGTRTNARGVDLNRNFADRWTPNARGRYYGGPKAMSEPETKALFAFVSSTRPQYLVSLHQPWAAVDNERVKSRTLQKNLSRNLGLPIKWTGKNKSGSRGTLVGHVNAAVKPTAAITVEFSANPSKQFTDVTARNGIVKSVGGSY